MKIVKNIEVLLVYWHLCKYINIDKYIIQGRSHEKVRGCLIGYGVYYDSNVTYCGVIKNNIVYEFNCDQTCAIGLYLCLLNDPYIKSLGLKVNYLENSDYNYYKYWRCSIRNSNDRIYLSYANETRLQPYNELISYYLN